MLRPAQIADANDRNRLGAWTFFAKGLSPDAYARRAGVDLVALSPVARLFNSALAADVEPGREAAAIQATAEFFQERGHPWFWTVGPTTRPVNLRAALLEAGFAHAFDTPQMARTLRDFEVPTLDGIVEVRGPAQAETWLMTMTEAFGMPPEAAVPFRGMRDAPGPTRSFLALDGDVPVATGMVYYGSGVAGIYCVATIERARGKGFGSRVTQACLAAAVEDGSRVAILQASTMGRPVYEKLGFREYGRVSFFTPPEAL